MYPILWQFGDIILPAWHVFFVLAALATGLSFVNLASADGYPSRPLRMLYGLCYFGGYFGARAFNIIFEEPNRSANFFTALLTPGGMTFYGGFLGALTLGCACLWFMPLGDAPTQTPGMNSKRRLVDLALLCGILGLGIGRIGCFLNGDDYGLPVATDSLWRFFAVSFPKVLDFIPRYPVQLTSSIFAISVFAIGLAFWHKRRFKDGQLALATIASYALFRFCIEFLRGDPRHFWAGYSISQWVSGILVIALALLWFFTTITKKKTNEATERRGQVSP